MAEEQAGGAQQRPEQQFTMQKIYTKDLSFESPATPAIFTKQWQPTLSVDLNTRSGSIDEEGNFEVVLSITVTAKMDEETGFLIEVHQAGVFLVRGFQPDELKRILGTAAPNVLFPYAREAIDAFCIKGGFPPLMLAPVNFEAVYQQAQTQAQAGAGETASH